MIPKKLTLCGFKSFAAEQVFIFPSEPGLYSLSGKNNYEPALGSNGAGKSTIWDGLCWVLYGKTVRGVRAGDLKTWGSLKGFYGRFEWLNGNHTYNLYRSWKPNKLVLTVDGNQPLDVAQEDANNAFGLSYESFLFSILMGQSRPMFLDLRASEQAQLFSEVFMLNRWLDYSDKAGKQSKELLDHSLKIDNAIAGLESSLNRMRKEKDSISDQESSWEKEHGNSKKDLSDFINANSRRIGKLNSDILILEYDDHLLSAKASMLDRKLNECRHAVSSAEDELHNENISAAEHQVILDAEESRIDYFSNHSGANAKCVSCGQRISNKYANGMISKINIKIENAAVGLEFVTRLINKKSRLIKLIKKEISSLQKKIDIVNDGHSHIKSEMHFKSGQLKALSDECSRYKRELSVLCRKTNPFEQSMDNLHFDIREAAQHLGTSKRAWDYINEKKRQTEYWIKGFKDIRLFVMSEFLAQLEMEVNNALLKLGLVGWKIKFSTEKENKSKTIKKGFHVLIKSPNNKSLVPWESWSGGESQRLRLAGNMGLSNLILTQYGITSSIEIWDEPTNHLGKEGVYDLLEVLRDRALLGNKQIWIVEHNVLDFGDFSGGALIVKGNDGSIIQQ